MQSLIKRIRADKSTPDTDDLINELLEQRSKKIARYIIERKPLLHETITSYLVD